MNLIDLPAISLPKPDHRRLSTVLLVDGPCAGTYAQVANVGMEVWQRVGKPGRLGVETQMWSRYESNPTMPRGYHYSGVTVTTDELQVALARAEEAGHSHGESYGA